MGRNVSRTFGLSAFYNRLGQKRPIMDRTGGFKPLDVLLNQKYLSPKNPKYLKEIREKEFATEFHTDVIPITMKGFIARSVTVIPLHTRRGSVIPFAWILDTGAPRMVFLGKAAYDRFVQLNVIGHGPMPNVLLGKMCWRGRELKDPIVECLPVNYNSSL